MVTARLSSGEQILSRLNLLRYDRQIILPQIGVEGQRKLRESKVLIIGAGGLGSVVAYWLACSGIGYIGIIDPDTVQLSNLQRQILHNEEHIGMPKVISAMITLRKINSEIEILPYPDEIYKKNALDYIKSYDVVVACPDNFKTRKILNDACFKMSKPLVIGAVSEFEGQVFDIIPPYGPCYNCIFEEAEDEKTSRGILAPVAGVIGSIQAVEAIKILIGFGELLHGRMIIYNALNGVFRDVKFSKNPSCRICK
ncbi:HesA/MoeB/ThiF family protein [Thermodesulfovibrio sp. 3907-1M]|uniref:HesA/MoeB/ThiF family protein n=1 Tax=Thermodesulfovibrio autotrophicus TaxID=3118333 RepID=A0AAU8GU50_9BACT